MVEPNPDAQLFKLHFYPDLPPRPPQFDIGTRNYSQKSLQIEYDPNEGSTPFNQDNYPQINNPYYGNISAIHPLNNQAYGYVPFGLHPFMYPNMGAYGINPLLPLNYKTQMTNPFMNTMNFA